MDRQKAESAAGLVRSREYMVGLIKEINTTYASRGRMGVTTVTIPTRWLPSIARFAEEELNTIDENIAKL